MLIDAQEQITTPSAISSENIVIFWKYSNTGFLLAAISILVGIWLSKKLQDWRRKRLNILKLASKLPGPPSLPLIGNALQFIGSIDDLLDKVIDVATHYDSPFRFWLGPKLHIVLTEPCDIEVILNSSKAAYKGSVYRFMEPFIGRGLVTGSGPTHRTHRRIIMPMLSGKVLDAYVEYFDHHSRRCADRLEEFVDTREFDIHSYMEHCTLDVILDTIMGTPGTVQLEGYKQLVEWNGRMYQLVHARMMKFWLHSNWIFRFTKYSKQQDTAMRVIHGFTESIIERKKKEHYALERGSVTASRPRLMLLEQLIAQVEKNNLMDDKELRDQIYTIFTAAQDTTAVTGSFVLLMLAMHPEIQDKVRVELFKVLGDENVTAEHLSELKYLDMVIKETLRLFPIAPLMVRELKGEIDLETCTLPEGCSVVMVPYLTHRDPKYWLNPEEFDPERFTPERSSGRHSYSYVPFSGGIRSCIGQKYAVMCLKTIIANIVRRYRLKCNSSLSKLRLKTDISIRSRDGYKISISRL